MGGSEFLLLDEITLYICPDMPIWSIPICIFIAASPHDG